MSSTSKPKLGTAPVPALSIVPEETRRHIRATKSILIIRKIDRNVKEQMFLTWWCCRSSCGSSEEWVGSASSSSPTSSWSWRSYATAANSIVEMRTRIESKICTSSVKESLPFSLWELRLEERLADKNPSDRKPYCWVLQFIVYSDGFYGLLGPYEIMSLNGGWSYWRKRPILN